MRGGHRKLPVLATLSAAAVEGSQQAWSLRREDLERLGSVRERLGERRTVLVSGEAGRGRSLAVALAAMAAGSGLRTALVECDLLAPRLAAELGLRPVPGLHEYLRWEATPAEILQPLTLAGPAAREARHPLACVVAGRPASDPAVLFGLQSFRHMCAKLAHAYDRVVVLAPSLEGAPEGIAAVAERADCLLAGIAPDQRGGREHRSLRGRLRRLPVEAVGAVVVESSA
jgi:Mrp family chromosome partitioning ATPase